MKKLIIILLMLAGSAHAHPVDPDHKARACNGIISGVYEEIALLDVLTTKPINVDNVLKFGVSMAFINASQHAYLYNECGDAQQWNTKFGDKYKIGKSQVAWNAIYFRR